MGDAHDFLIFYVKALCWRSLSIEVVRQKSFPQYYSPVYKPSRAIV